jgi:hypothetical protein
MTMAVYRRLWCDGRDEDGPCGNWHGTAEFNGETVASIRRSAHIEGWVRRRRNGRLVDLCPECSTRPAP